MIWPQMMQKPLGVLMLDTAFPRPLGDIGNPATFAGKVLYHTVPAATVSAVVAREPLPRTVCDEFKQGAARLVGQGAGLITTSCGFLSAIQDDLAVILPVPVVTSALCLMPLLRLKFGKDAVIGIVTFDDACLGPQHVRDPGPYVVEGLDKAGELYCVIRNDLTALDEAKARDDALAAVARLLARAPDVSAIVLECTNLPPYRDALEATTGVPIYDIRDAIAATLSARDTPGL